MNEAKKNRCPNKYYNKLYFRFKIFTAIKFYIVLQRYLRHCGITYRKITQTERIIVLFYTRTIL